MWAAWYEKQGPARDVRTVGKCRTHIQVLAKYAFASRLQTSIQGMSKSGKMHFKNIQLFFLGSDNFPRETKIAAAKDLNQAFQAGWSGFEIAEQAPLAEIARAHELTEHPVRRGRIVVVL